MVYAHPASTPLREHTLSTLRGLLADLKATPVHDLNGTDANEALLLCSEVRMLLETRSATSSRSVSSSDAPKIHTRLVDPVAQVSTGRTPDDSAILLEAQCRAWVESFLGERLGELCLQQELKSGVVLCQLANAVKPGACANASSAKFKQLDNIASYLLACDALGVPDTFEPHALHEDKDMPAVLTNLEALARVAESLPTYSGPAFGPLRTLKRLSSVGGGSGKMAWDAQPRPNPAAKLSEAAGTGNEVVNLICRVDGMDPAIFGRFTRRPGSGTATRSVYVSEGGDDFLYYVRGDGEGRWWVGPDVGKRSGSAVVVSEAWTPEGIGSVWDLATDQGFRPAPELRCIDDTSFRAETKKLLAAARPQREVILSGKLPSTAQLSACLLGRYVVRDGELHCMRHVYRKEGGEEYLYYSESEWWVGDVVGERSGFLYVRSSAWVPEGIDQGWHAFADGIFIPASGVVCSLVGLKPPPVDTPGMFVDASFPAEMMLRGLGGSERSSIDCFLRAPEVAEGEEPDALFYGEIEPQVRLGHMARSPSPKRRPPMLAAEPRA